MDVHRNAQPVATPQGNDRSMPSPAMVSICSCLLLLIGVGFVYHRVLAATLANQADEHYLFEAGRIWRGSWAEVADVFTKGRPGWPPTWEGLDESLAGARVHRPRGTGGYYQPLVSLSLMFDAAWTLTLEKDPTQLWYSRAFQFHLTNLFLHLFNTILVYALARRLAGGSLWPILLALVFAVHPVQVESVAWIAQRMTLLGATFSLLAIHVYFSYAAGLRWSWFIPVCLFYGAALLCRPMFIVLPVVFLLLDIWPLRRGRRAAVAGGADSAHFQARPIRRDGGEARVVASQRPAQLTTPSRLRPIWEKTPLFLMMLLAAAVLFAVRSGEAATGSGATTGPAAIAHQFASLAARILWPLRLSPYQPETATVGGAALGTGFDLLFVALVIGAACFCFNRKPHVFVAVAGAGVFVATALIELPYCDQLLSDQYLYAALIVPIVVAAAWLGQNGSKVHPCWRRSVAAAMVLLTFAMAVGSYHQTEHWERPTKLYQRTVELYPNWGFGYVGLVESLIDERKLGRALEKAEQAVDVDPENPSTQFYLGTVLLLHRNDRSAEAVEPLRKALASNPNWIHCLQNLGVALAYSGRIDEAIGYLEKARDLQPRAPGVRVGLGNAYLRVNRFAAARKEFQEALRRRNDSNAHLGLAIAWAANDVPDYARRHLAAAVAKDPLVAVRASRSPHLQRLREEPGFEGLLPGADDGAGGVGPVTESPAALRAHGS